MSRNAHFLGWFSVVFFSWLSLVTDLQAAPIKKEVVPAVSTISSEDLADLPSASTRPPLSVTVVGSRIPTNTQKLTDIPANVSYKSKTDLDALRLLTFQDAIRDQEGVNFFDNTGNGIDATLVLRGMSASRTIFLVDGVRVNEMDSNGMTFPLLVMDDLESIQIDRGSASQIYGSDAFAGVVNLTSGQFRQKPLSHFGGLDWSSFHGLRFYEGISGTLNDKVTPVGGKFKYYFRGGRNVSDQEGYRANAEYRITSFDLKTEYELPDEKAALRFGLKHVDDAVANPGELTFQQFQEMPRHTHKPWDGRKFKNTIVQLSGDAKWWDDRILTQFFSSQRYNQRHSVTTSASFGDTQRPGLPNTDFLTLQSKEFNHILQAQYEDQWNEVHNKTLLGTEFRRGSSTATARDAIGGKPEDQFETETDRNAHAKNFGFFWRETLDFYEKVVPYVGMRHDWHWIQTANQLNISQNATPRWHDSTISTGLTVHPLQFTDLFLNYSQGFRVPTIDELVPFGGTAASDLIPEHSHSYGTGTRLRYKEISETKLSYFLIDLQDEIAFDSTAISTTAPFGQNINIGKSRRYGIELREDFKPIQEVKLYGSYTWMRAYVRETVAGGVVDGRDFGNVPQNRFTLGTMLTPLARLGEPYDGFRLGLNGVFTGQQHPDSYQSNSQATLNATGGAGHYLKPYSVWDFIAAFHWKEKEIFFKINNLFDEKYYSRAVNATVFASSVIYPAGTFSFVNPGAPREFVIGSRWEF